MQPVVVFLHGLGRTHRSLDGLRKRVEQAGYETWAETYPSRAMPIAELAELKAVRIREALPERELIAVTHSMGGILVRHMRDMLPWKGAVMLAPPNRGSRVAQRLGQESKIVRMIMGPTILELGDPDGWPPPPEPFTAVGAVAMPQLAAPAFPAPGPLLRLLDTSRVPAIKIASSATNRSGRPPVARTTPSMRIVPPVITHASGAIGGSTMAHIGDSPVSSAPSSVRSPVADVHALIGPTP